MKKCKSPASQSILRSSTSAVIHPHRSQLNETIVKSASINDSLPNCDSSTSHQATNSQNRGISFPPVSDSVGHKEPVKRQHKNPQQEQDSLTEALASKYSQLFSLPLESLATDTIENELSEFMYIVLVYTVNNTFGTPSPTGIEPQVLTEYIDDVFSLPPHIKHECNQTVKSIAPPKYLLQVTIYRGIDLTPCDADGLCDPYCKVWIGSAKDVVTTSIKEPTLNPVWNETFMFKIKDFKKDVLHIEVWDKDPEGLRANLKEMRVRGSKGGWLLCREFCQNICSCASGTADDFVGKVDIKLKDIYSEGIESLAVLKDQMGSLTESQLHFSAEFVGLRPKNISESLKRHFLLLKMFLKQSMLQGKMSGQWEKLLAPAAKHLVLLHRRLSALSSSEDLLIKLIVFIFTLQSKHSFDFQFLFGMIEETKSLAEGLMMGDCALETNLWGVYKNVINVVYDECQMILNSIHSINFSDVTRCLEFEYLLRCLEFCCGVTNRTFPWDSFKSEAISWLENVTEEIQRKDLKLRTDFILKTIQSILDFNSALDKVIIKVFPHHSYSELTYETLDCFLSESLKSHIKTFSEQPSIYVADASPVNTKEQIELFIKIKELNVYLSETVPNTLTNLANYEDWFGSKVFEGWYRSKGVSIAEKVPLIVTRDRLENVVATCAGRTEKQSVSVNSIANLIQEELVSLWMQIRRPKYPDLNHIFLQVLHSACMLYAECLLILINSRKLMKNFGSSGKRKLCVIANDLWSLSIFVKETVAQTIKDPPPDSFNTKFCLQLICRLICEDLSQEMQACIYYPLEKVVWATTRKRQKIAVGKFAETISSILQEGKESMAFEIYLLHLEHVWKFIVKVVGRFQKMYNPPRGKFYLLRKCCRISSIAQGLHAILAEAEKMCYIDPEGKLKSVMWTDEYVALKKELQEQIVYG